jgi:hypothetical protein
MIDDPVPVFETVLNTEVQFVQRKQVEIGDEEVIVGPVSGKFGDDIDRNGRYSTPSKSVWLPLT